MRRLAALGILLCLLPSGPFWLAGGVAEGQACAMACAHAPGEEVCCPLEEAPPGQPMIKSCAPDQRAALHRTSNAVLSTSVRLTPPVVGDPTALAAQLWAPGPERPSPDHVPIRFS